MPKLRKNKKGKIIKKEIGLGIPVSVASSTSSYGTPPVPSTSPSTSVMNAPPATNTGMYWPAPPQWFQMGKEATKKALLEYVNATVQLQNETDNERRFAVTGKLNLAVQNLMQGIAIGAEAAELQAQRARTGDQSAVFELNLTEDCLRRMLKMLWAHNLVAKKGVYPGLEIKMLEGPLVSRINRTTTITAADDGVPIDLDKGEDPNTIWMMDYMPPPPGQAGPGIAEQAMMAGQTGEQPMMADQQGLPPEVSPSEGGPPPTTETLPVAETEALSSSEGTIPEQVEGTQEEMDTAGGEDELSERETMLAQKEGELAKREEELAAREAALEQEALEDIEEEEIEVPEGEEEVAEDTSEERADGIEEQTDEAEELADDEEEVADEVEQEEDEEGHYCLECDKEVDLDEIQACENPKCPLKNMLQEPEEEVADTELKHYAMVCHEDHSDHKICNISFKEYTGLSGCYCSDCNKIVSYEFEQKHWDQSAVKDWITKQFKNEKIKRKEPDPAEVVTKAVDYLHDDLIKQFIEEKKKERGVVTKSANLLDVLTEGDLSDVIRKSIQEAWLPMNEKLTTH